MTTRKELKKRARQSLKKHYGVWILLCALCMWLGGESIFGSLSSNISYFQSRGTAVEETQEAPASSGGALTSMSGFGDQLATIILNIGQGKDEENKLAVQENLRTTKEAARNNRILGRSRGVLSDIINRVSSGSFFLMLGAGIHQIVGSNVGTMVIYIILSLFLMAFVWVFFLNLKRAVLARMLLEGRSYDKIHLHRTLYLFRSGHWFNASMGMLLTSIFQTLWSLTIIGGFIKHFSYFLVPYIIAENPSISPKKAIRLSRDLMYGHKWECFVLYLSFIGWEILDIFTLGILEVMFIRPYQETTFCEFYAAIRDEGRQLKIHNAELLNDTYLYEHASEELIKSTYSDAAKSAQDQEQMQGEKPLRGIYLWLVEMFGITIRNTEAEKQYAAHLASTQELYFETESYNYKTYPARLNPLVKTHKAAAVGSLNPMRSYSIWSIILIFFTTSLIGWLWEVSLHLISDGVFVNRGVLHGPWLPIYGTGSLLMIVLLYRFRKNPFMEFLSIIVVCGCVEYWTAYYLEMTHNGTRWWDYSGYFLNLHGRICAEGLLVFGLGGIAIVYVLAPLLDNLFKKIPFRYLVTICILLLALYTADNVYSGKHPNEGEGITSYTDVDEDFAPVSADAE